MGSITVAEREHWAGMIEEKLNGEIKKIELMNKGALSALQQESEIKAIKKLGIEKLLKNFQMQVKAVEYAEASRNKAGAALIRRLEGECAGNEYYDKSADMQARKCINEVSKVILADLMDKHPIGKQIRDLEREKSELSNAVWIATSNKKVVDLYSELTSKLCGYDVTTAEAEALDIANIPDAKKVK